MAPNATNYHQLEIDNSTKFCAAIWLEQPHQKFLEFPFQWVAESELIKQWIITHELIEQRQLKSATNDNQNRFIQWLNWVSMLFLRFEPIRPDVQIFAVHKSDQISIKIMTCLFWFASTF